LYWQKLHKMSCNSFKYSILILAIIIICPIGVFAKKKITFMSEDGVSITADLYYKGNDYPYVLMFHQDGSSRGEYNDIAERIVSLDYNCLAVDLRVGGRINYVENETAEYAKNNGFVSNYIEAEKDMDAAIDYVYKKSRKPIILFGSSFSSSLCLKLAINNARISAVVAFDPGEYLKPEYTLNENIHDIDKPVFVATNKTKQPYVKKMFEAADSKQLTFFISSDQNGETGAKALWPDSKNNKESWLALLMFFSKL